jgi:holo-[acyl-carrier protein] synthase
VSDAKQDCRATATVAIAGPGRRSACPTTIAFRRMPNAARKMRALPIQMSVIGIGVDVIECSRIQHSIERFGDRFLHRVFTDGEIEYSMSMKFPERHLAARFAGKEAVAKAFGTGIGKAMGWRNIDIQKRKSGEPFLVFTGPAEAFAAERGVISAFITLSHTENYAVACAVLEG